MTVSSRYLSPYGSEKAVRLARLALVVGVALYASSFVIEALAPDGASWWLEAVWKAGQGLTVLCSALLIGGGGYVSAVRAARRDRLIDETGLLLMSLCGNIRTLAETFAATAWRLGAPLQLGRLDEIDPSDAALLLYTDEGRGILIRLFVSSFDRFLHNPARHRQLQAPDDAAIEETSTNAVTHVGSLNGMAVELHERGTELFEYMDRTDAFALLAATADVRRGTAKFREDLRFGPQDSRARALTASALFLFVMTSLGTVVLAAEDVEEKTALVLEKSPRGRDSLKDYRTQRADRLELRRDAVDLARLTADMQRTLDEMFAGLDDVSAAIGRMREERGLPPVTPTPSR